MTIDYRQLNDVTLPFAGSVPIIDELIYSVKGKEWLSTFDLATAYHQLPVAKEDQIKTTFVSPLGTFKYVRVPFGLKNAVQFYCTAVAGIMCHISCNTPEALVGAYLDDIIIGTDTFERHLEYIEDFLACCVVNSCKISLEKSDLFCKEVSYLGFKVNGKFYKPDPDRIKALQELPKPNDIKSLRSFLGSVNYYSHMLCNIRTKLEPLQAALRGGVSGKGRFLPYLWREPGPMLKSTWILTGGPPRRSWNRNM